MKRSYGLLLVGAAIAAGLVSCSKSAGASSGGEGGKKSIRLFNEKVEIDAELKKFAANYEERTGVKVEIETAGGGADNDGILKGYKASDNMPDIFYIRGPSTYNTWKSEMEPLDGEAWINDTSVAYKADGHVWGFPYAVEGFGMAYNADILQKAGVDPKGLTTFGAYKAAFEKIDAQKDELGLKSVVSLGTGISAGMAWVTAGHNVDVLLSAGLARGDTHVIDGILQGKIDRHRLEEYGRYVKLLFDYSDRNVLLNGNYDQQLQAFTDQKAAFLHQGNWVDPTISAAGASFPMAFAPHAFSDKEIDGVQADAPAWWVVYKNGEVEEAKKFLLDMATSPEGRKARIENMKLISPYLSDKTGPPTPLSASLAQYVVAGKTYAWEQNKLPDGFADTLGPIYELLARGDIDATGFCDMMQTAIAGIAQ